MNKKLKEWEQASSSFDFDETFVLKQIKRNKHKKKKIVTNERLS